jgi:2-phospho-L-lactate/phosphoenolpyruvate guanylyltransferase
MRGHFLGSLAWRRGIPAGCCALIAVKARAACKTRLQQQLVPGERIALVRRMLAAVISAAHSAQSVAQVIVLSPERDTVPEDVPVLADSGHGLNAALMQAQRALLAMGCRELLILPADLPNATAAELDRLVRAGRRGGFAIAPDLAQSGTNALCLATMQEFQFRFGAGSRQLHLHEARRLGLKARTVNAAGLAFDIDTPADLLRWNGAACLVQRQA